MALVTHLIKSGSGMALRTACGRNILRTQIATDWQGFVSEHHRLRCEKCDTSTFAEFMRKRESEDSANDWVPEDPDAWKRADDALLARRRTV